MNADEFNIFISNNYGFLQVPRVFFHIFEINAAVLLGQLVNLHNKAEREKKLDADGFFYANQDFLQQTTSLSKFKQRAAKQKLLDYDILYWKKRGIPARLHYKINIDNLIAEIERFIKP